MTVGTFHKRGPRQGYSKRNECRTYDTVVFVEQDPCEEIEMSASEVANGGHLAGVVISGYPAALNLITDSIGTDGINVRIRIAGLFPSKCLTKEILRKIAGGIVRTPRNAPRANLIGHF